MANSAGRPISIVYFCNERQRGGVEEHILTLLRGLNRERFQPHLVCPPELADRLAGDLPDGLGLTRLTLRGLRDTDAMSALARLFRRLRPRILHSHLFYASLFASPIARLCGVPVTVETPHLRELWRHGWKAHRAVDRIASCWVDAFIAVSAANAAFLQVGKGIPGRKIHLVRNGADLSRFDPHRRPPAELYARYHIPPGAPVLVALARLEPQKGHALLLKAMPAIRTRIPEVHLVCVGEGRLRGQLEVQCRELGLDDCVHFPGYQSAIADHLALATATVLPSLYEGLPLAAIESLAAGRPVLASRVDGTPEVVRHQENGLTFPSGNWEAIAEAVITALSDRARCRLWGSHGRRWVERHFSQEAQIRQTEAVYLAACARHARAAGRPFLVSRGFAAAAPNPAKTQMAGAEMAEVSSVAERQRVAS